MCVTTLYQTRVSHSGSAKLCFVVALWKERVVVTHVVKNNISCVLRSAATTTTLQITIGAS